jgi:tRNA pseudouridine55 synthase
VTIKEIQAVDPPQELTPANPVLVIDIVSSKGTYIRSLARDIGEALSCPAYMSALVRTSVSQISLAQAATLEDLETSYKPWLLDMSVAVQKLNRVDLDSDQSKLFGHGRTLSIPCPDGDVAVFRGQELLGIARAAAGNLKPAKVLVQE